MAVYNLEIRAKTNDKRKGQYVPYFHCSSTSTTASSTEDALKAGRDFLDKMFPEKLGFVEREVSARLS